MKNKFFLQEIGSSGRIVPVGLYESLSLGCMITNVYKHRKSLHVPQEIRWAPGPIFCSSNNSIIMVDSRMISGGSFQAVLGKPDGHKGTR